jgi:hypothetical protein
LPIGRREMARTRIKESFPMKQKSSFSQLIRGSLSVKALWQICIRRKAMHHLQQRDRPSTPRSPRPFKRHGGKYNPPPSELVQISTLNSLISGVRTIIPSQQERLESKDQLCVSAIHPSSNRSVLQLLARGKSPRRGPRVHETLHGHWLLLASSSCPV